jgi:molybdate transport system substrate-binding protein
MRSVALLGPLLLVTACASGSDADQITVFAASSLTKPFTQLAQDYEREHPGTEVVVNFAGSADLVAQLDQGASASVLATADEVTMLKAQSTQELSPLPFATNAMTMVVPAGNPAGVKSLDDLTNPKLNVVICAPQVPCGAATRRVEDAAGISIAADSEESAVADVLGKVTSGQADAGIVYVSDVTVAGETVSAVPIPEDVNTANVYLIAALSDQGQQFADFVLSDQGQQALDDAGFGPP